MISAIIFAGHLYFVAYIFTKKWQEESLSSALINFALITILFAVGWSITSSLTYLIFDEKGLGIHFDGATISLTFLTIIEYFFYKFYYKEETIEAGKEM
ncbi:MAG: hypothetical protein N2321_05155 [Melioribacteraceae bacterium]|nr:hypothetical protein [Melioribacteraceae bacterium]